MLRLAGRPAQGYERMDGRELSAVKGQGCPEDCDFSLSCADVACDEFLTCHAWTDASGVVWCVQQFRWDTKFDSTPNCKAGSHAHCVVHESPGIHCGTKWRDLLKHEAPCVAADCKDSVDVCWQDNCDEWD